MNCRSDADTYAIGPPILKSADLLFVTGQFEAEFNGHLCRNFHSCAPKGKIILNQELIKTPKRCIEYVIVHEICHLLHHDHTRKFIDLQKKEMPDWEKWKEKLEKMMA
ncbi:MAG: M48 family metallopeptidase [Flavobacteriales bacterium]|nr:M48 family metallopeptidase [Flavobacteriales bacterium]